MKCRRCWFTYYGWVGSSSPTCRRGGCNAPNPRYRPDDDPLRPGQAINPALRGPGTQIPARRTA